MTGRAPVDYGSRAGSTAEGAARIAERLRTRGLLAEAWPLARSRDLVGWDAIVLGSATHVAARMPEMVEPVSARRAELVRRSVAAFTLHMLNQGEAPEARASRAACTAPARALVAPVEEAFSTGLVDPARPSFADTLTLRMVGSPVGDLRDGPRRQGWAEAPAPHLVPSPAPS